MRTWRFRRAGRPSNKRVAHSGTISPPVVSNLGGFCGAGVARAACCRRRDFRRGATAFSTELESCFRFLFLRTNGWDASSPRARKQAYERVSEIETSFIRGEAFASKACLILFDVGKALLFVQRYFRLL